MKVKMKMKKSQPLKLKFPETLQKKLDKRKDEGSFRALKISDPTLVDFSSNDYLGFSKNKVFLNLLKIYLKSIPASFTGLLAQGCFPETIL